MRCPEKDPVAFGLSPAHILTPMCGTARGRSPSPDSVLPQPSPRTNLPQAEGAGRALLPPPPTPHPLHPLPYPHAHPHAPGHPPSPDDSSFLRRQGNLAPRKEGVQRGISPSGKGPGGCAPSYEKTSEGGRVGPTNVAMPTQVSPWRLAACPKDDHRKVQSHFNGPISRRSPAAARCGCRASPALFPFVDFGPSFTEALGLRSARALADTTCSPLSTFPTPPRGAVRPPSGQCLADTTCLPLSTCPSRLNPKLRRVAPGRTSRKKRTAQFSSVQTPGGVA